MSNIINIKKNRKFFKFLTDLSRKKAVEQIFNNIKVTFEEKQTTWFANDGEISYFFTEQVENSQLGFCVFNGNLFWNFLKKVKSDQIESSWNGSFLNLIDGKNKVSFKLYAKEFESGFITKDGNIKIQSNHHLREFKVITEMNTEHIKKVIENGLLAVNDEIEGILSIIIKNNKLKFLARDSRRLCITEIDAPYDNNITITARRLIMEKVLEFATEYDKIQLYHTDSEYMVHYANEYLIFKKLKPDSLEYDNLCGHQNALSYTCKISELKEAVEFVTIMCSKLNHTAQLIFNGKDLNLQVIDPNQGKCTREIVGQGDINGSIYLNAQYLLDAIMLKNSDDITLYYKSKDRECVLINGIATHVIMPIVR